MSNSNTITIIPALGLRQLSDSDLNTYAMERNESYILHGDQFPGLKPTQADLEADQTAYSKALGKLGTGGESATIGKDKARTKVEKALSLIAENAAEIADGDLEKYTLLGFGYKSKGASPIQLDAPANFNVVNGPVSGSVKCKFKGVKNNHGYEAYIMDETSKLVATGTNSSSPLIVYDLTPLKQYKVKCRAIGARGKKGLWTTEITISVI